VTPQDTTQPATFTLPHGARLVFLVGDITRESCDAIVNAANSSLLGGGGVDGAIHRAGGPQILEECKVIVSRIGRLPAGEAVITTAGKMPSRRVVHTVGPVWYGGDRNEPATLATAWRNSLRIAHEEGLTSIAFPSISTGAFGYPTHEAAGVAVRTVAEALPQFPSITEVRFVLFDDRTFKHYVRAATELLRSNERVHS
jgi:O-acetyl-ADP-ribose deacetylase (regulator of RNase III)